MSMKVAHENPAVAAHFETSSLPTDILTLIWSEIQANGPALWSFFAQLIALFKAPVAPSNETVKSLAVSVGIGGGLIAALLAQLAANGPLLISFITTLLAIFKPAPAPAPAPAKT